MQTGELLPINAFLDTDANAFRDMIITVLQEYEDGMSLTKRMEDLTVIYGSNADSDYETKYEDVSVLLNYEYYYDGEYYYIILNHGIFNSSGCLLKWNGKYGEERESVMMLYGILYRHEIMRKEYGVDGSNILEKMDWEQQINFFDNKGDMK